MHSLGKTLLDFALLHFVLLKAKFVCYSKYFSEKAMATHSSTLAWKIPWTEEPGGLQSGVARSWTWLSDFTFTFHFHTLETEMATHSSALAWRIPGMGEPSGLPSMGSHGVGHDWSDLAAAAEGVKQPFWGKVNRIKNISSRRREGDDKFSSNERISHKQW